MTTEQKYIQMIKAKNGEERLKIAFALRKLALKLAEASIRANTPNISKKELHRKLLQRIYGSNFSLKNSSQ